MKKYENPMLQIVSINKKDIIATSETWTLDNLNKITDESGVGAADRFRDWED